MNNIVDALRVFGKKLTGTDVTSDTIANSIGEIAENYTGGGSGGSDIPVLEFEQTSEFDGNYFTAVCNTENVDWIAVKNRIDSGKPVDAYFVSEFTKDRSHSGSELDMFRLAAVNTYGPVSHLPYMEFIFKGASSDIITISVNRDTAEVDGLKI